MNILLLVAAALSGLLCVAHVVGGGKMILQPMLGASFDPVAKRTMYFCWHYVTLALAATAGGLAYAAFEPAPLFAAFLLAQLGALALLHFTLASTAKVERGVAKMFQWAIFATITGVGVAGLAL